MSMIMSKFKVVWGAGKAAFHLTVTRPISTASWKGKPAYKSGSPEQQDVIDNTFQGGRNLGFDSMGAETAQIGGGYHDHVPGGGPINERWITVQYFDAYGNILYHMKKDGSEWDRIHLFKDRSLNLLDSEIPVAIYTK